MTTVKYLSDLGESFGVFVRELDWQKRGLTWTATGYGAKIPSRYVVELGKRTYRVYATCYSNAASHWIMRKGERLHLLDGDFPGWTR